MDPSTAMAFSVFENRDVYALLLGSGISRAAQIPTGWEITLDLIRRVAALEGVTGEVDWAAWHHQRTGKEPNYSEVLDALTALPVERRSILRSYIEPTAYDIREGRKIPKVFREVASGAKTDRTQLRKALDQPDQGDVLMVTRLDRLARSTRDLLNTLNAIITKGAGFERIRKFR